MKEARHIGDSAKHTVWLECDCTESDWSQTKEDKPDIEKWKNGAAKYCSEKRKGKHFEWLAEKREWVSIQNGLLKKENG